MSTLGKPVKPGVRHTLLLSGLLGGWEPLEPTHVICGFRIAELVWGHQSGAFLQAQVLGPKEGSWPCRPTTWGPALAAQKKAVTDSSSSLIPSLWPYTVLPAGLSLRTSDLVTHHPPPLVSSPV